MLSHAIPSTDRACAPPPPSSEARPAKAAFAARRGRARGPFPLPFHPPLRRQGPDLDPGAVPAGSGEGRLRGRLRLSVARHAGARLRRPRAARRDRRAAGDDAALFARARRFRDGAARARARSCAWTRRGACCSTSGSRRRSGLDGRGGVRRAGAQVPDLGAGALSPRISRRRAARVRRLRAERGGRGAEAPA